MWVGCQFSEQFQQWKSDCQTLVENDQPKVARVCPATPGAIEPISPQLATSYTNYILIYFIFYNTIDHSDITDIPKLPIYNISSI